LHNSYFVWSQLERFVFIEVEAANPCFFAPALLYWIDRPSLPFPSVQNSIVQYSTVQFRGILGIPTICFSPLLLMILSPSLSKTNYSDDVEIKLYYRRKDFPCVTLYTRKPKSKMMERTGNSLGATREYTLSRRLDMSEENSCTSLFYRKTPNHHQFFYNNCCTVPYYKRTHQMSRIDNQTVIQTSL
jgi:hypothetical protein